MKHRRWVFDVPRERLEEAVIVMAHVLSEGHAECVTTTVDGAIYVTRKTKTGASIRFVEVREPTR